MRCGDDETVREVVAQRVTGSAALTRDRDFSGCSGRGFGSPNN